VAVDQFEWWWRPLHKPRALRVGDRVAVVSPSWGGPSVFPGRYEAGKQYLERAFGLQVVAMPNALRDPTFLDENPEARANDLMQAFEDASIAAVIATIGGEDAVRLIPFVDLKAFRRNPKIFVGYSDSTVIHFGCLKAGIGSLHGPSLMSGFAENCGMSTLSEETFRQAAFNPTAIGELPKDPDGWTVEYLPWQDPSNQNRARQRTPSTGIKKLQGKGCVKGHLIGGCAEVLELLKGSDWWPPPDYWDNAILFYETSEEAPSATLVLRWLRNFAAQGILQRLSGMILARPGGNMSDADRDTQQTAVLRALREAGLTELPVLADADIGHTDPIATLPYGVLAEINCDVPAIGILESAVAG
jgi:muramoyltetrapeptide carboxypeptidase LdcA involved in peptidoglycan recycling